MISPADGRPAPLCSSCQLVAQQPWLKLHCTILSLIGLRVLLPPPAVARLTSCTPPPATAGGWMINCAMVPCLTTTMFVTTMSLLTCCLPYCPLLYCPTPFSFRPLADGRRKHTAVTPSNSLLVVSLYFLAPLPWHPIIWSFGGHNESTRDVALRGFICCGTTERNISPLNSSVGERTEPPIGEQRSGFEEPDSRIQQAHSPFTPSNSSGRFGSLLDSELPSYLALHTFRTRTHTN
jgi:hypothetical protein